MYEKFITDFEHRINQLSLVEICLPIVRTCKGLFFISILRIDCTKTSQFFRPKSGSDLFGKLKEKVKHEPEAVILTSTAVGAIQLEQKNFEATKRTVEETETQLNELDGITTVHARFYELSSSYYRTMAINAEYYKNALRYLGCLKSDQNCRVIESHSTFFIQAIFTHFVFKIKKNANVLCIWAWLPFLARIYNFGELVTSQ